MPERSQVSSALLPKSESPEMWARKSPLAKDSLANSPSPNGFRTGIVTVRVPATSGNLGPGFDCLGLAYDLYDQVSVQVVDRPTTITVAGEGAGQVPLDETHLVLRAFRRTVADFGINQPQVVMHCVNHIPHGRGLGSSAAAVVAGIMAARELLPEPHQISRQRVLELSTEFEGHPDNAAPAIFGGATASWLEEGVPGVVKIPVSDEIKPILLVPNRKLATSKARAVLPKSVPHQDAVFNLGRVALLTQALATKPELLLTATADRLHQPYRSAVMPESAELVKVLRQNGIPAVISGAGPTVLAFDNFSADQPHSSASSKQHLATITDSAEINLRNWRVLCLNVDENGAQATYELHSPFPKC